MCSLIDLRTITINLDFDDTFLSLRVHLIKKKFKGADVDSTFSMAFAEPSTYHTLSHSFFYCIQSSGREAPYKEVSNSRRFCNCGICWRWAGASGRRGQPLEQLRLASLAADGWPGWHHRTMGHKSHESPTHKDAGSSDLGSGLVWDDAFDSRTSFITAARLFTTVSAGDFPFCSILFYFISLFLQILAAFIGFCVLAADAGIAVFYFLFSIFHFPLFRFDSGLASLFLLVLHYGFLWFIFGFKWFPPALNTLWLFSPGFGLSHFFGAFLVAFQAKLPVQTFVICGFGPRGFPRGFLLHFCLAFDLRYLIVGKRLRTLCF